MPMWDNAMHQITALPVLATFDQAESDLILVGDVSGGFAGKAAMNEARPYEVMIFPLMADPFATALPAAAPTVRRSARCMPYAFEANLVKGVTGSATDAAVDLASDLMSTATSIIDNTATPDALIQINDSDIISPEYTPAITAIAKNILASCYSTRRTTNPVAPAGRGWKTYMYGWRS